MTTAVNFEPSRLSVGQCITLACILEATAPKPGNVHRGADFEDLTYLDFAISAAVIGPIIADVSRLGVGRTILQAVQATRHWTETNSNLGTILLLSPLAAVSSDRAIANGIDDVLNGLSGEDARLTYDAIVAARPGGMGRVEQMDIREAAPDRLLDAMQAAAERDLVARQYVSGFHTVLHVVVPKLLDGIASGRSLTDAIIHTQIVLLAEFGDSLILRKCGSEVASRVIRQARRVLDSGLPGSADYLRELADFDFWLRSDGHRRNPGTTADLIAAGLFVALRERQLQPPFR